MFTVWLSLVSSAFATGFCEVNDPGTSAFIRNSYVELGLGNDGAFGEGGYPAGWHYRSNSGQFGFVANPQKNGWASFYGDFFSPGSPLEGWGVQVAGTNYTNFNGGGMGVPGSIGDPACNIDICGNLGGAVEWSGAVGGLTVKTQYGVVNDDLYIVMTVTLTNTGSSTLSDVYWFRNVDPDNSVMNGGGYATTNTIISQPSDASPLASVKATGADGADLFLLSADDRARVTHGGFYNSNAGAIWSGSGFSSAVGATANADEAISLAVRIGDMAPGQEEVFRVIYTLDETAVAAATACAEAPLDPDADGDGVPDATDPCPNDPLDDADADGVCGDMDVCPGHDDALDEDDDGTPDGCDVCPLDPMDDIDADGVCGDVDLCPFLEDDQSDLDGDGDGDACDTDADADGFEGAADCDDLDASVNVPPVWYMDADVDGFGDVALPLEVCVQPEGYVADATDCDDDQASVNPGSMEVCDGENVDENCNDVSDDADDAATGQESYYNDMDGDGFGHGALQWACDFPATAVQNDMDCNDTSALAHPGGVETCDTLDNNCDGTTNETTPCYDDDRDGMTEEEGDCDDGNNQAYFDAVELPDDIDNDCDTLVDDELPTYDDDGDGMAEVEGDCDDNQAQVYLDAIELPDDIDNDCDTLVDDELPTYDDDGDGMSEVDGDCNDAEPLTFFGAVETLDGKDNNCDAIVDNNLPSYDDDGDGLTEDMGDCDDATLDIGLPPTWYADGDADGYGDSRLPVTACEQPEGHVADAADCNDRDDRFHPYATEPCDSMEDFNCDGSAGFVDADGDHWAACADCDDSRADVNAMGVELCDGHDNDCNGSVDDNAKDQVTWYADGDGDGAGDWAVKFVSCSQPEGYVAMGEDCDDADPTRSTDCSVPCPEDSGQGLPPVYAGGWSCSHQPKPGPLWLPALLMYAFFVRVLRRVR